MMGVRYNPVRLGGMLLMGMLVLGVTACSFPNKPMTSAAAEVSEPLSSGEILQILHTINQGEIEQAELALRTSQDSQVRQTARLIMEDHSSMDRQIENALQAMNTSLEQSSLSEGIQFQAEQIREELADLTGSEFNRTYLQKQVELHEVALDTVRTHLIPNAKDTQIQQLLSQAESRLQAHRQEAQQALRAAP